LETVVQASYLVTRVHDNSRTRDTASLMPGYRVLYWTLQPRLGSCPQVQRLGTITRSRVIFDRPFSLLYVNSFRQVVQKAGIYQPEEHDNERKAAAEQNECEECDVASCAGTS